MRMKHVFAFLLFSAAFTAQSQTHKLELLWQTDTVVAVPESVLPDSKKNVLFVSLIDGAPWAVDGKGGVSKLSPDGKRYDAAWITGLNAPKGMGLIGNRLFVADVTEVVVIDVARGRIEKKIAIDSAKGLNDITVSDKGTVYVSDSRTGKIWRLEKDVPALFLDNISGVNGLKSVGNALYIGAGKQFIRADEKRSTLKLAELPQGIDGIEPIGNGDFILTSWAGYVFYVSANGTVDTLLETHPQKKNTADIGYDDKTKTVYIPTFNGKTVAAYRLN